MSRLDSFIRRMTAQRDILNAVAPRLAGIPGPVLEFGLGSGRTYDHLRQLFPERRIVVFECMAIDCPITCPDPADLVMGDIRLTAADWPAGSAALVHADIETGIATIDRHLADWLPATIARLLVPGGFAASGAPLGDPALEALAPPGGVEPGRYHLARRSPV